MGALSGFLSIPHNSSRRKRSCVRMLTSCVVKMSWLRLSAWHTSKKYFRSHSGNWVCKLRSNSSMTKTVPCPFFSFARAGMRSQSLFVPSDSSLSWNRMFSPCRFLWMAGAFRKPVHHFPFERWYHCFHWRRPGGSFFCLIPLNNFLGNKESISASLTVSKWSMPVP